ncbi:MAG: hypothetical protein EON50_21635 [Acidovorax sp.]|nr:MAG: hypothetical protein EON50_21635 [Acidovorax sp.]
MNRWTPISRDELGGLLSDQLAKCLQEHAEQFARFRVPFRTASVMRGGVSESVFIVAQLGQVAIYYEDVEEGFNVSEVTSDGSLVTPGFEQWTITDAIQHLLALPHDSVRSEHDTARRWQAKLGQKEAFRDKVSRMQHPTDFLRAALEAGTSFEGALLELRTAGATPIQTIKAISKVRGCDLGDAKQAFAASPAWAKEIQAGMVLHDQLLSLMSSGSN